MSFIEPDTDKPDRKPMPQDMAIPSHDDPAILPLVKTTAAGKWLDDGVGEAMINRTQRDLAGVLRRRGVTGKIRHSAHIFEPKSEGGPGGTYHLAEATHPQPL